MSKIYIKSSRIPLIVKKEFAEKIHTVFTNKLTPQDEMITVVHSLGKNSFTFGEIKGVDVTYNDNDYNASKNENTEEKKNSSIPKYEPENDEDRESFKRKSEVMKKVFNWK